MKSAKPTMSSDTSAKTMNEQFDAKELPTKDDSLSNSLILVVLDRLKDIFGPMLEKQTAEIIKKSQRLPSKYSKVNEGESNKGE